MNLKHCVHYSTIIDSELLHYLANKKYKYYVQRNLLWYSVLYEVIEEWKEQ